MAVILIVSSGNKSSVGRWDEFIDQAETALAHHVHLLLIDPYPPTARAPNGVHGAVWDRIMAGDFALPADADRTLVAYAAGPVTTASVEPTAVGQALAPMRSRSGCCSHASGAAAAAYRAAKSSAAGGRSSGRSPTRWGRRSKPRSGSAS